MANGSDSGGTTADEHDAPTWIGRVRPAIRREAGLDQDPGGGADCT